MRSRADQFETDILAMLTPVLEGKPPLKRRILRRNFDKFEFGYSGMKMCYLGEFTCDGKLVGRIGIGSDVIIAEVFNSSSAVQVADIEMWCRILHCARLSNKKFNLNIQSYGKTLTAREPYYRSIVYGDDCE